MRIQDDGLVIEAAPGIREQALNYGLERLREREKTRRTLIIVVAALSIVLGSEMIFAPADKGAAAYVVGFVLLVLSLGAIGASSFFLKTPVGEVKVMDDGNT